MIKSGTKVKIICLGRRDCKFYRRKDYIGKTGIVYPDGGGEDASLGLAQWKDNMFHYGNILLDGREEDSLSFFHEVRVKIIKED